MKFSYRVNLLRCVLLVPLLQARARRTPIISAGSGGTRRASEGRRCRQSQSCNSVCAPTAWTSMWTPTVHSVSQHGFAPPRLSHIQRSPAADWRAARPVSHFPGGLPVDTGKSCPANDDNRMRIFSELRNDFSQLAQRGRLKRILLYTWQGDFRSGENNPYGAFIGGAVTKGGHLAVAPM